MKQNVIIIENLRNGKIVVPVENFSDDNVKEAISKNLHREVIHPVNDLRCLNADTDASIYAVNNAFLGIKKNIESTAPFYYNSEYDCKVRVSYATIDSTTKDAVKSIYDTHKKKLNNLKHARSLYDEYKLTDTEINAIDEQIQLLAAILSDIYQKILHTE